MDRMNIFVLITIVIGFHSVVSIYFYECSDNGYCLVCDWSSDTVYRGCVATDVTTIEFQYFDKSSTICLGCSASINRITIMECNDCGNVLWRCEMCRYFFGLYCSSYDILQYSTLFHFSPLSKIFPYFDKACHHTFIVEVTLCNYFVKMCFVCLYFHPFFFIMQIIALKVSYNQKVYALIKQS